MRKTRIVKKEETVLFCDVCGKKIQNYTSCSICYRELCDNSLHLIIVFLCLNHNYRIKI